MPEAENAYKMALKYAPDLADTYLHLGHAFKLQQRTDEAVASYVRAFALDPTLRPVIAELEGFGWSEGHLLSLLANGTLTLERLRQHLL